MRVPGLGVLVNILCLCVRGEGPRFRRAVLGKVRVRARCIYHIIVWRDEQHP